MRLYFTPGACSLSPHIVAREAGIDLQLEKVDLTTKKTESGKDFSAVNPKGYIPVLELDNGQFLTEGPAIVQYLADQKPAAKLAPENGSFDRYRLQEMLGFINSELHKSFGPLFNPNLPADQRQEKVDYLHKRFALVEKMLASGPFLFGEQFSVADAYLFTVTSWTKFVKVDISAYPNLQAFMGRVAGRPAVQAALKAEGLLQA